MCWSDYYLFCEQRVKDSLKAQEQKFRWALAQAVTAEERFLITLGFLGAESS